MKQEYPAHLRYVRDDQPGFTRRRWGRGYMYLDCDGRRIGSATIRQRIKSLAIPPAWSDVWICPQANGHLQATGKDGKNRKQYIYHPDWTAYRNQHKFDKLASFGTLLPVIRNKVDEDLDKEGWPREKVLALAVALMDRYFFRVGKQQYARENKTYGIATLRRKHLHEQTGSLLIQYTGKSGKRRRVKIDSAAIARKIRELSELPGYEVFRYQDDSDTLQTIDASDINGYLHEITGAHITAKDFRTWGGSLLALLHYRETAREVRRRDNRQFETSLVRRVAKSLGNTVSVCRQYYIHPKVLASLADSFERQVECLTGSCRTSRQDSERYLLEIIKQ